jgi:hypothetical protein
LAERSVFFKVKSLIGRLLLDGHFNKTVLPLPAFSGEWIDWPACRFWLMTLDTAQGQKKMN